MSSSSGSDANSGTSPTAPWATVAKVNAQNLQPGDSVLFKRGEVWNESLAPLTSGTSASPISFDAYGTGAPPNFTGYYAIPTSAWVHVTGNAWKAPLPSLYSTVNFCLFGSVWGQKVSASTSNLKGVWDFYLANGALYVFSQGNPSTFYNVPIVPMALSNTPVINVNNRSWLTFQHILVNWFDQYGVYVQGTSDHLVFANMESDSMIPQGTQPLGFYVNESAPGPGDIKIYNSEAHLNYDGFRFDGVASGITMANDKAYANRDSALVDNTSAVRYSYCHFYASSLAVVTSTDVTWTSGTGPIAGAGNIGQDVAAAVQVWQRYPAMVTLTVDDPGMTPGADTYYANTVLPVADAAGVPVGVSITVGYPLAQTLIPEFQSWVNAGRDVASHSISHTYYTNTAAMDIQYTGSGTAAALSISNKVLTITVNGAGDSVSYNLAQGQPQGTIQGLEQALLATGVFTVSENPTCQGPYGTGCSYYTKAALLSQDLADVSAVDVKGSMYHAQLDATRLTTDEITLSRQWMTSNLTGLTGTPVYVYPGGYETTAMQGIASGVYGGARGALHEDTGVKDTYASGFDVQNITSFGVDPSMMGLDPAALNEKVQSLVWKEMVWGVPWGIFWHWNAGSGTGELSATEIANLIADLQASGATIQSNSGLVDWLRGGTLESGTNGNFYYKLPASRVFGLGGGLDLRPTGSSPVVDVGQNLGAAYQIDINGVNQNSYGTGWEIGAHVYLPQSTYGIANASSATHFAIGGGASSSEAAALPLNWVNENEITPAGGVYDVTRTASTFAQVQQAICDWVAAPDQWWLVQIPHGTVIQTNATGYTCTQPGYSRVSQVTLYSKVVGGAAPTKFIVFDSDTPLLYGQTVCSHGITDWDGTRQPPSGDISTWWTGGNNGCASDIGSMWTLEGNFSSGNSGLLIQTGAWDALTNVGPSHYAFRDAEFRMTSSVNIGAFMVNTDVGANGTNQTMVTQDASHIHFQNIYGHGDATDWCGGTPVPGTPCSSSTNAGGAGNNQISTFFKLSNCASCSLTYSYVDYSLRAGSESHLVGVDEGPGPIEIAHNWLSGASIALFTGGVAATDPLYSLYDLFVWQNRLTNPPSWVGNGYGGANIAVKNRSEIKTCERCLFEGNIAENVDASGSQQGQCFGENPRACSNSLQCDNYQVTIEDVTYSNNICRHALTGFSLVGRSSYPANGGGAAGATRRLNITNNLLYDLGNAPYYDKLNTIAFPYGMRTISGGQVFICGGINASGTIILTCAPGPTGLLQTAIQAGDPLVVTNCSDPTWNMPGGNFLSQRGAPALAGTNPNGLTVVYANAAAVGATASGCLVHNFQGFPASLTMNHNTTVMQTTAGGKNNGRMYNSNTYTLLTDSGCTGAGPVHATAITAMSRAGGMVTATVASMSGWPTGLNGSAPQAIVEVLNSGTFTGTFYFLGQSGGNLTWLQAGAPDETAATLGTAQMAGSCPANVFGQNNVWKNNLLAFDLTSAPNCPSTPAGGWTGWATQGGGNVEGCQTSGVSTCSENAVDPQDSVVTNTNFPGRCGANYTEIGGPYANAKPPMTLTFPASTVCSGATADSSCIGMKGMMSGAAFDANDADYHQYGLLASSQYKAGAANDADDGTDLGADIAAIDNALTRRSYPCAGCGGGPKGQAPKVQILAPGAGQSMTTINTYLKPSPYITGIVYHLWWACSDQDGTAAHYTWAGFDNRVITDGWAAAGKKIIVVIGGVDYGGGASAGADCDGGSGYGTAGIANYATPAFVWTALGSANFTNCTGSGGTQQIPNYLHAAYLNNYENWVAATLAHLAGTPYASSIQYVRVAWGKGGETTPFANWDQTGNCPDGSGNNTFVNDWGYTIAGWENFLQTGMTFEAGVGSRLPLMISITPMGNYGQGNSWVIPNFTASSAASLHIGFGMQGLQAADVNNCAGSMGNWCNLFATYAGKVQLETQTFMSSCPTSNMNGTCSSAQVTTGSLDGLLSWAARNHATTIEIYNQDACAMLCPGYSVAGYAAYPQAGYSSALMDVVGGSF